MAAVKIEVSEKEVVIKKAIRQGCCVSYPEYFPIEYPIIIEGSLWKRTRNNVAWSEHALSVLEKCNKHVLYVPLSFVETNFF